MVVQSTLAAARADVQRAATLAWTVQNGEVRKAVTGEARTGEAKTEPGVLTTSVNEAEDASTGDVAEGGEPSETVRRTQQQSVVKRHGRSPGRAVSAAVKLPRHDRHHRHVGWRHRRCQRSGQDIAVKVGSVVNMNGVTGNDDDAKPAPTTRT